MDLELIRDYLQRSGVKQEQARALSRIFDEMATKSDLTVLEKKIEELRAEMARMETRLSWRIISVVIFMSTVLALVEIVMN
jgi:hypothetical protein